MYFIEFLTERFLKKRKEKERREVIPDFEGEQKEIEDCSEHVFMPIDSTGEVLSCINCGLVVHKKDLHRENPF